MAAFSSARWPGRKVHEPSEVRTDRLEIPVSCQQGEAVLAASDCKEDVIDQRAWPLFVRHPVQPKQCRQDAAALLECRGRRAGDAIAALKSVEDSILQGSRLGISDRAGAKLLHDHSAHIRHRRVALQELIESLLLHWIPDRVDIEIGIECVLVRHPLGLFEAVSRYSR